MNILVTSYAYAPSVGGIETVTDLMARAFAERGHGVEVVTHTPGETPADTPFPVLRRPGPAALWRATRRADVVWQNNVALHYLWAPLLMGRPTGVTLQCAVFPEYPRKTLRTRLKARLLKRCRLFAISRYVLNDLDAPHEIVGNPFDAAFAKPDAGIRKDRELAFVGRLVSDKGADLLLDALAALETRGLRPECTFIGDGPERSALERRAADLGLAGRARFTGFLRGRALHAELARHRILVVPSRWKEPFGIVALEGIAAGCAVVGSSGGGLGEAIGPCGRTFANNDADALTGTLRELLENPAEVDACVARGTEHLGRFSVERLCDRYLDAFAEMIRAKQSDAL